MAMKLVNFASLDPAIVNSGRSGLGNASSLDKEVWDEFHADWEKLAIESEQLRHKLERGYEQDAIADAVDDEFSLEDFTGETKQVLTAQRVKQQFFRRAVLSSYRGRCCMSGLSEPRLLIASHIVPWSKDKANRLNPSNGLCLSAIHDKAFDKGLITLSDDLRIILSDAIQQSSDAFVHQVLLPLADKAIELPERFSPSPDFILRHRSEVFVDSQAT